MNEYSKLTIENKNFFKRFSHKRRFVESANFIRGYQSKNKISMLDFGCGNGFFIKYLIEKKIVFDFFAYDPVEEQITEMKDLFSDNNIKDVKIFSDYQLIDQQFDVICCLETLEHFKKDDQKKLLEQMLKLLKPNGVICISVPIEVYFSGFVKMTLRILMGQSQENTSFKNLIYTLFGKPILNKDSSENLKYLQTHVGFYYFNLMHLIKSMNFEIEEIKFSPFPKLKFILNSQIFLKIKHKKF